MAGRGKLIAVMGDEDTVTGFLLGGIGELDKHRRPNFLVVEKETSLAEIEETFRCVCVWGEGGLRGVYSPNGGARVGVLHPSHLVWNSSTKWGEETGWNCRKS